MDTLWHNRKGISLVPILGLALFSIYRIDINGFRSPDKIGVLERKSLTELLVESNSDKYSRHHYERYYDKWLAPYRDTNGLHFLEIGANEGHSLNLWADYFDGDPAIIVGLAYGKGETIVGGGTYRDDGKAKVTVVEGDQSSSETIKQLTAMGPWDAIIDDGSHVPQHVLTTLFSLWPTVKKGGIYVIEDLETNYWRSGSKVYGYPLKDTGFLSDSEHSVVYKLKEIIDVLPRHQLGFRPSTISVMPGDESICSIEWGMNIVALKKCPAEDVEVPVNKRKVYSSTNFEEWMNNVVKTNPN